MNYYALIKEEKILGVGQCYCTSEGCICIEITEEQYNLIQEKGNNYYIYQDNELILNPEYEDEEEAKERERKDRMTLTPADVERALYKAKGMDFEDLKVLINQSMTGIDTKALAIEFRAKDFYRGAMYGNGRLFDIVGALLGYTPDDMDYLFLNKELPEQEVVDENTAD